MIRITCTSCKTVLNIDDAFAGGVCRCQHCGTIQTVPAKQKASTAKTAVAVKSSKTLFSNKARVGGAPGSGLEDLADIVASSGLSDKRLRKSDKPEKSDKPAETINKKLPLLLAAAAGVIVALLIVVIILIVHNMGGKSTDTTITQSPNPQSPGTTDNPGNVATPDGSAPAPTPAAAGPNFCGVALTKDPVVYLIDNGSSSNKDLDFMKNAVYKSAESLGINRNFEILFWNVESRSFPTNDQTAPAVAANIDPARKQLDDVDALGLTDPTAALARALKVNPGEIVLITAKSGALEESLPAAVMSIRGTSTAKIDCIAINGVAQDPVLSEIASKTGGTYANISEAQLRAASY